MGSSLLIALSMYSILPVPRVEWKEDNMRWSLACLPVVGLMGGGLLAGWAVLTWTFPVSPIFFGAVAALLPIILSGGFHMDGFLDATDAIFSRPLPCCPVPRCCCWSSGRGANWSPPRCFGPRVPPVFCPAVPRSRPGAAFPTPNPALSGFCLRDVLPRRSPLRGWRNMRSGSSF